MARDVPLSQDESKVTKASRAECIRELRRIAQSDVDRVVTRNRFRVEGRLAESAWNVHFGTFEEFKRQAGIILSRHAHRLEKHIAKHASVDKLRALTKEKAGWEDKYLRPSSRRWQTALVLSDVHDLHCDPFFRRVVIDTAARAKPEKIVLNGDIFDLPEFSKHTRDPREFSIVPAIKWVHAFLADLRRAAPDSEILFVEGNHEFRLLRHMGEQTQAMMVVLADLHGYTVPKLLGLESYGVNYIARADMTAWNERDVAQQLRKNYVTLWDNSLLFGHFPEMRAMGIPGASGHHHKHIVWTAYSPVYGPWEWHQIGAGHQREASYCNGEKWANGFLLAHCDTHSRRTQFEYVDLSHPAAMVGGKFYQRTEKEPVLDIAMGKGRR
ncbi:metallophosphoesterase [Roseomonas sp. USHLN139]|uniref:metallophosphoesterase n=1 Tax=Roseomonas sp. USHLN139 TaxID=3081298 RepID=UPI003B023BA2